MTYLSTCDGFDVQLVDVQLDQVSDLRRKLDGIRDDYENLAVMV